MFEQLELELEILFVGEDLFDEVLVLLQDLLELVLLLKQVLFLFGLPRVKG